MSDYQNGGTMVMTAKDFRKAAYKQSYAGRKSNRADPAGPADPAPIPKAETEAKAIAAPTPMSPTKIWASASSHKNQPAQNNPAKFMAEAHKQAEAYKHMTSPTKVRKAIKADAERKKAEREQKERAKAFETKRKGKARAVELEAQSRMQKIRSEIDEIKQKESQQMNINLNKQPNRWAVGQCKRKLEMELNDMKELEELANLDGDDRNGDGDDKIVDLGVDLQSPKEVAKDGVKELDASFPQLLHDDGKDMKGLDELANLDGDDRNGDGDDKIVDLGVDLQSPKEVAKDGVKALGDSFAQLLHDDGKDMKGLAELTNLDGDDDAGDDDGGNKSVDLRVDLQLPKEVAKYGVKELGASFAQLLHDNGKGNSEPEPAAIKIKSDTAKESHRNLTMATSNLTTATSSLTTATRSANIRVARGGVQGAPSRRGVTRTPSNLVPEMRRKASRRDLMFDDDAIDIIPSAKDIIKKLKRRESTGSRDLTPAPEDEKESPSPEDEKESPSAAPNETLAIVPAIPVKKKQQPSAEKSQTRKELDEQREKLEGAKASFQKGHDLCWKFQDSSGALGEYRNALIVRETLLGKFHEDTGRSYYWIGRSLVKLEEYDEGLMAFTRALRIFERVLLKNHKYVRWVNTAIDNVFKEQDMEDAEEARDEYKKAMEASIASEREGDACRKKGQHAQAIDKYRDAIDNIEQYHPDAADLFCKIAIILRGQGEFDQALEEYRYASEIYELSLGADHPETVKTLNTLIEKKRLNQISMASMEKLELKNNTHS